MTTATLYEVIKTVHVPINPHTWRLLVVVKCNVLVPFIFFKIIAVMLVVHTCIMMHDLVLIN